MIRSLSTAFLLAGNFVGSRETTLRTGMILTVPQAFTCWPGNAPGSTPIALRQERRARRKRRMKLRKLRGYR
jgi:hypothetical protein